MVHWRRPSEALRGFPKNDVITVAMVTMTFQYGRHFTFQPVNSNKTGTITWPPSLKPN